MPEPAEYVCPYTHDGSLEDSAIIYRLVPAYSDYVKWIEDECQISSNVFSELGLTKTEERGYPEPATSLMFHAEMRDRSIEEAADLSLDPDCGIVKLTVGDVRQVAPEVGLIFDGRHEPWHGILFAVTRRRLSGGQKKALRRKIVEIVREPSRAIAESR